MRQIAFGDEATLDKLEYLFPINTPGAFETSILQPLADVSARFALIVYYQYFRSLVIG
jgi:hypothetical protein